MKNRIIVEDKKYFVGSLVNSDEFRGSSDILLALYNANDLITKSQARKAIKKHLEREVK